MRVHLIDGTFELFRAHYSKRPPHADPSGRDLKATVGVVQSLLTLFEDGREAVTHLAVAFDNPIVSFRNDLFDGYKTDAGMDPALRGQFDDVEAAVAALGVVVWSMKEFEADDALAAAVKKYGADPRVTQVRILTPDKDLGQMLDGERVVQLDRIRNKLITEASQLADKGLRPASVPDFLALVGDTSDGIPGIDGWGEKGAAQVLAAHPHLEDIPANPAEWKTRPRAIEKMSAALNAGRADALLYRRLATLRTDVPLPQTLDQLAWKGAPRAQFEAWSKKVGASLAGRVKKFQ
jgi:5'-3' exonuclease